MSATLTLRPAALHWRDVVGRVENAALTLMQAGAGYRLSLRFTGDLARGDMAAANLNVMAETPLLRLGDAVTADALQVKASAQRLRGAGVTADAVLLTLNAKGLRFQDGTLALAQGAVLAQVAALDGAAGAKTGKLTASLRGVTVRASGIEGNGEAALDVSVALPEALRKMVRDLPVLAMDAPLKTAVTGNLGPFAISAKMKMARHGGRITLTAPLTVQTPKGGMLRIPALAASWQNGALSGSLQASLAGGGLPPLALTASSFTFNDQGLRAAVSLHTGLDFAVFKGIDATLDGALVAGRGAITFTLARCEPLTLAAMAALATKINGQVCPADTPLFALDATGWRAAADTKGVSAFLPLANAQASEAAAHLAFDGKAGPRGSVTVTAAKIADAAAPLRFKPVTGSGTIDLADNVWRGRFAASDEKKRPLGTAVLTHAMAGGDGGVHVEAALTFAQNGLQPEDLSPLLAPLKKADGRADFKGDIAWSAKGLGANTGTLTTKGFDFLTPMGRAHALDTTLVLTSLLPPATADGQALNIARIDWTLPFSDLGLRFGFTTQAVKVERVETNIAEGHVALSPFTVTLAAPQVDGRATVTSLSLAPLIAASNLSGKAAMEGRLSGVVPFTAGPGGFRITGGRLAADGPGRLSLNRSLWGDAALTANMAQDFAYQALENLAFDSLSADIDSIDGGRLKVVFHIKGHNAPPKPQSSTVELALPDILNGSVLQRPIPLPSGVPIELTLDTSLNFDELLQSYAEAWSKALNSGGADP